MSKNRYAKVMSVTSYGVELVPIEVECHQSVHLPSFQIVGLPTISVREARERVASALESCELRMSARKFVVNLLPAWLKKEGTSFDLAIALAILLTERKIPADSLQNTLILGELSLDGRIKGTVNPYLVSKFLRSGQFSRAILPMNAPIWEKMPGEILRFAHLRDVIAHLRGEKSANHASSTAIHPNFNDSFCKISAKDAYSPPAIDFSQIQGHKIAKQALQIAVAGGHSILLHGPHGQGKTLLAQASASLHPPLREEEREELAFIYSARHLDIPAQRPFRQPHYSLSDKALLGGGAMVRPGELSLAHHGTLFLDELLEIPRATLEALRTPLEQAAVTIARGDRSVRLPCRFHFVAATNHCPCGRLGRVDSSCPCAESAITRYQQRLSGALLERFDLQVYVMNENLHSHVAKSSADPRALVIAAQARMLARQNCLNNALKADALQLHAPLHPDALALLEQITQQERLSARAQQSLWRVSLTCMDLEGKDEIELRHILQALHFRPRALSTWRQPPMPAQEIALAPASIAT
jgi:magnesium chelatase family protein